MVKFVDTNKSLVDEVSKLGIPAIHGDYFIECWKTDRPVLMTASNPLFTFGGGLDYQFRLHFPQLCGYKRMKGGGMERIANIVFAITVDDKLKASHEQVETALRFALENTQENETLVISGVGTGIGGMSTEAFVEILKRVIT